MHHLLTHSSGLPGAGDIFQWDPEFAHLAAYAPGEHFHYNNAMFDVLGILAWTLDGREFYADPNWSWLAWGRQAVEEEEKLLGADPWPYGLENNRANLERFVGYSLDQGLMAKQMAVEELFMPLN